MSPIVLYFTAVLSFFLSRSIDPLLCVFLWTWKNKQLHKGNPQACLANMLTDRREKRSRMQGHGYGKSNRQTRTSSNQGRSEKNSSKKTQNAHKHPWYANSVLRQGQIDPMESIVGLSNKQKCVCGSDYVKKCKMISSRSHIWEDLSVFQKQNVPTAYIMAG